MGYWSYDTYDNLLIDNILVGGASLDNPLFPDSPPGGLRDYSTGHSLYIVAQTSDNSPVANSLIEVQDNLGTTYSGISNSEGYVRLDLLETTWRAEPGVSQPTVYPRSDHALFTSGYLPVELSPEVMAISDNPQNPVQVVFTVSGEGPSPGPPVNVMWQ